MGSSDRGVHGSSWSWGVVRSSLLVVRSRVAARVRHAKHGGPACLGTIDGDVTRAAHGGREAGGDRTLRRVSRRAGSTHPTIKQSRPGVLDCRVPHGLHRISRDPGSGPPSMIRASQGSRFRFHGAGALVAGVVAWNVVTLRAETVAVPYLDDSSLHEQMVRFAASQLQAGHIPLKAWFPYLGVGSPQFLHYQSLPAMITGLAGVAVGPDTAFRWSLYLLLCAWPLSVYVGARLFGISRWGAAAAAALSPLLMSATGVGYEQKAYVWIGYGVWTQLWASMMLPIAWGLGWRAIRTGRYFLPAAAAVSLTIALHFETGYLALLPLLLWPVASWGSVAERGRRSALIFAGTLGTSAWVIVPLIAERNYAATNEILQRTPLVNGYGAERVLGWLVSGQLLDAGRLPVVTLFAGIGLALGLLRWRRDVVARPLVLVFSGCLLLSFGRTTFGRSSTSCQVMTTSSFAGS